MCVQDKYVSRKKILMTLPVQVNKSVIDHVFFCFLFLFSQCNWDAGT